MDNRSSKFHSERNKFKEELISTFIQGRYLNKRADIADILTTEEISNKAELEDLYLRFMERK